MLKSFAYIKYILDSKRKSFNKALLYAVEENKQRKKSRLIQDLFVLFGGSDEDRTRYLLHAMEALSQVSYGPTVR